MKKNYSIIFLIQVTIIALAFPVISSGQDLSETQKQERCQNNKTRIAELETQLRSVDADLSHTMTAKEMNYDREQLAFVRKLQHNYRIDPSSSWDPKKVAQISKHYNYIDMDKCLDVRTCLWELENIIVRKIDKDKSLNRFELLAKKNEIEKQLAVHKNNLIALGCDANNNTGNTPDISGSWKALNWTYQFTQNGRKFTWKITNDAAYNETGYGEFLEGNRIKATWTNKNGTDSGKATVIVENGRAVRIKGDNGVDLIRN